MSLEAGRKEDSGATRRQGQKAVDRRDAVSGVFAVLVTRPSKPVLRFEHAVR